MVSMADRTESAATNFNAIRISIASPEQILNWSHGEVTKPETINYRTLRPEKDGLFCERLFGPTKDWECFCGKYKRIRYRGVVCDRCGVEVTRAKVRRERMGHIRLAAPVAHIWFSKTNPSRLGLLLDLSPRNLERVLYFAQHIIVSVDEDARQEAIEAEQLKYDLDIEKRREVAADRLAELNVELLRLTGGRKPETANPAEEFAPEGGEPAPELLAVQQQIDAVNNQLATDEAELASQLKLVMDDINDIQKMRLLAESRYREQNDRFADVFVAGMGAEAILAILRDVDLEALRDQLITDMHSTSGQRRQKAIKRLRVVESFRQSGGRDGGHSEGTRAEDMILTVMPVLPPELRPMVQLDGGRFATSDLNDLYRRVINRNNRLKRLMSLGAPEIIIRNEKRMLQEAVDALIDNGRRGRPIQGSHNHKLKSLSDLLRGKQGRFRQNLLGKRVDYSGRSVIVVGPELKMNECGLPRRMALELFKPFVMHRLVVLGIAPNIKNAKRMVERARGEVWDILEDVIKNRPVLLNRAPTLHRLGIQAFMPVLIDGHAIQIHPLVCSAFNADFDGDQMAVHVPLSRMAVLEAQEAMLSTHNMLSPASGEPLVAPTLDMVMGCFYLTEMKRGGKGAGMRFADINEARNAYEAGDIELHSPIRVGYIRGSQDNELDKAGKLGSGRNPDDGKRDYYETTLGRLIFNEILPDKFVNSEQLLKKDRIQNKLIDRDALNKLTSELYRLLSNDETAEVLDSIKTLGFRYATWSGTTIAINDIQVSRDKDEVLEEADRKIAQYNEEYQMGLISEDELYAKTIEAWAEASSKTAVLVRDDIEGYNEKYGSLGLGGEQLNDYDALGYGGIGVMALSGAKGNTSQINQMAGMRGLMNRPRGRIIELPVKSSFREGLTALEYFISTHGARKGLTDTALNTANSGYLTRRLIDIAQEVIIQDDDCGTADVYNIPLLAGDERTDKLNDRIKGRFVAETIADPQTGEVLVSRNELIDLPIAKQIEEAYQEAVAAAAIEREDAVIPVRSPLTCEAPRGVCRKCYGWLPATAKPVEIGQAVGIIAAQSIGEPGTQLTMRTFHTGGVANVSDITVGLPRVEELFEARVPKGAALLADIDGGVEIQASEDSRILRVVYSEDFREEYPLPEGAEAKVEDGDIVEPGITLALVPTREQYALPEGSEVMVDDGEEVTPDMVLASVPNPDGEGESAAVPVTAANAGRVEVAADAITVVSAGEPILATVGGRVEIAEDCISVIWEDVETREHVIPGAADILVSDGGSVIAGDPLTRGPKNPHDILRILGKDDLQSHLVDQVQAVYQSQGVGIHDKHIEIILRQMLRRVQVKEPGDTEFIPGEVVDKFAFQEQVAKVLAEGGEPATADQVLLGVTRASLRTDSFLSAASFQETTRVLTEAAVRGQQDYLLGLKENVIIGRLIPAQVEIPGMAELLKPQPALDLSAVSPGWLRAPAETDDDDVDLSILGPEADDDGFERMARQVARTYARDDADEDDLDDFFDDDDDAEATTASEPETPLIGLATEAEGDVAEEQPEE